MALIVNSCCFAEAGSLARFQCGENIYFLHIADHKSQIRSKGLYALLFFTSSKWIKWIRSDIFGIGV